MTLTLAHPEVTEKLLTGMLNHIEQISKTKAKATIFEDIYLSSKMCFVENVLTSPQNFEIYSVED